MAVPKPSSRAMSALSAGAGSRALSYVLGSLVIGLALAVAVTARDLGSVIGWADQVFGPVFIALFLALVFIAVLSLVKVQAGGGRAEPHWFETGMQCASGIATLALTFTLLGISLGIGTLADQTLNPETVQDIIRELTANFATAFMTTVVGLPVSAILRALLMVAHARNQEVQVEQAGQAPAAS